MTKKIYHKDQTQKNEKRGEKTKKHKQTKTFMIQLYKLAKFQNKSRYRVVKTRA
jgi:hypothetical protein